MKIRGQIYLIIISVLIGTSSIFAVDDYYKLLGLNRDAGVDTIRKKCYGAEIIWKKKYELSSVKKRLEGKNYVRSELIRQKKQVKSEADIKAMELLAQDIVSLKSKKTALEKDIARLIELSRMRSWQDVSAEDLGRACAVLRSPKDKRTYDMTFPREKGVPVVLPRESYYTILGLEKQATDKDIKMACQNERGKFKKLENDVVVARKTVPPNYQEIKETPQILKFKQLEKEYENAQAGCKILQNKASREKYDKELATKVPEKEDELGRIRRMISGLEGFGADKIIVDIVGEFLSMIPIPDAAVSLFNQKLAMRNISFVKAPFGPDIRIGIGFTGTMFFNNISVVGTMYVVRDNNKKMQYALSVELPDHYKISSMFPKFKKLDTLSLPRAKLIVSSFDYYDSDGFGIKKGLNFASLLDLTGPLKALGNLKDRAKHLRSIVVRAEPIRFQGVIPKNIQNAEFSATIPMRFGIDFTKIPKIPKTITKIFKEFTTDDLEFAVTVIPTVAFTIETGVRLVLGTQREPIRLSAFAVIEPTMFSLGMRMRNMLQLYFLSLGNVGIQIDWDDALAPVAAVLGIPFTGIGLNGQIDLGKEGESRAVFKVSGGTRLKSSGLPDIVFEAEASNIRFADILKLLLKMAAKGKIIRGPMPFSKIPSLTLERVRGYLSLEDTKIAGKTYEAGFALEVDTHFFNRRAGFSIDLKHTALTASGAGYISNIDIKVKGKDIFKLTGPPFITKAGKSVEGPAIDFSFGLKEPMKGRFGVRGIFEVPAIDLKQSVDFVWSGWNLRADFESTYAGFTVVFGAEINLKAGAPKKAELPMIEEKEEKESVMTKEKRGDPGKKRRQMYLHLGFKGDFAKFLTEQARPAIDRLKNSATEKLGKLNEEMANLSRKVSEFGKKGTEAISQEIQRTQDGINSIKRKIVELQKERSGTKNLIKKGKLTAQIGLQQAAMKAKEAYRIGLLKPGQKVVAVTSQAVASVTNALHKAQILKRSVEKALGGLSTVVGAIAKGVTIFQVKEAIGEISSEDIRSGKLFRLTSLIVETNIPGIPNVSVRLSDVLFDLKRPIKSGARIAEQLIMGIKFTTSGGAEFSLDALAPSS